MLFFMLQEQVVSTRAPAKGATDILTKIVQAVITFQLALPRKERHTKINKVHAGNCFNSRSRERSDRFSRAFWAV